TLADAAQPEALAALARDLLPVRGAVVDHLELDRGTVGTVEVTQDDVGVAGGGVLADVGHRLLGDAVQGRLHALRHRTGRADPPPVQGRRSGLGRDPPLEVAQARAGPRVLGL